MADKETIGDRIADVLFHDRNFKILHNTRPNL